jgi:hypothetical protein
VPPSWKSTKPLIPPSKSPVKQEEDLNLPEDTAGPKDDISITSSNFVDLKLFIEQKAASIKSTGKFSYDFSIASEWLKLLAPLANWKDQTQNQAVTISKLAIEGLPLPFVRGDGLIPGDFTAEEVVSVIRNKHARLKCTVI